MKTRTMKGESSSKGRDTSRADTEEDLQINPFARSSKIPRDDPTEDTETKQETSRRSSQKDKEDPARSTPPLARTDNSSSILQDLKAYLDKRDEDLKAYLSQELAIREELMEEKLKSLIDPQPVTLKTEEQDADEDSAPASEQEDAESIHRRLRTAYPEDPDNPDDEDPSSSEDDEKPSRPKRASGRGRPEKIHKKTKKKEKEYTGSRLFKHAEKLPKFRGRDDESFSVWLGKYEMMMFTLYNQSKKMAYDCLEIALEEEAYSSWKNWALENPEEELKNWKTFKKWAAEAWNGRARRRHLYKTATRINMRDGKLTVEQYFSKFQECLRLSGKHMSTEDKIETLKDGLRADIRKLLAFSEFDTVADLKQAALEIENLDEEKAYPEEIPNISKPRAKPTKSGKKRTIDLTATATNTTPSDVVICEHCSKEGHRKSECWIFLATQGYCGRCKESGHTIFKNCPKVRAYRTGKPGAGRRESKREAQGSSTTFSTAMKTDSTYQVSSTIPIHTSTGIKTGILDSGSGVTLIKKTVAEEIPGMPPVQPATKLIQSSEGSTQAISESVDLYLRTDQGYHSKIPSYLYDTSAPFDVILGTDFLQQEQAVMAWTTEGLRTFLIPGLADELVKIYDPVSSIILHENSDKAWLTMNLQIPEMCCLARDRPARDFDPDERSEGQHLMDTSNWVLAAFPEIVDVILHTSEEEDQEEIPAEEEKDRDDWIWEDNSDVPLLSSQMMPFGVGPSEGPTSKVQSLLNQVWENDNLTSTEKKKVRDLIRNFADIFATQAQDLESCTLEQFQINLVEGFVIPTATPYRSSIADDEYIEKVIKELLDSGLITPSKSSFASPVVIARAPGRAPRFCIDYRALNRITIGDSYPLPSVEAVLRDLSGYNFYCCFDLKSGYWQIPIREQDRHKTAFVCKLGLFEWTVMPFGLKNAPACFQRITDFISNQINSSQIDLKTESKDNKVAQMKAYLDDLTAGANTFTGMMKLLEKLFSLCRELKLKLHPDKCSLFLRKIRILGHMLTKEGIHPMDKILRRIRSSRRPENKDQVRAFLGLVGYYQKFIPKFTEIADPLQNLLPKEASFSWGQEQESSFVSLRNSLSEDSFLIHPDNSSHFYVATDASDVGMGAVLLQKRDGELRPIQFASKRFSPSQRKYSAPQRECLAMIWGIERFHYYLYGRKFTLLTDHDSLKWLKSLKSSNKMFFRWTLRLNEYDFNVLPKPGIENGDADGLSRFQVFHTFFTYEQIKNFVRTAQVPEELTKSEEAKLKRQAKNYRLAGNALLIKNREEWLLFPSPEERSVLIKQYHERAHQSASTVLKNLKLRYYWPKMDSEVAEIISKCVCFRGKSRVPTKTTLKFPQLPWKPFSHIEIDLVGELPITIHDFRWVLVVQDYLTKYVLMFPITSKDALTIAALLVHQVFYRFGFPKKIQSDQGSEFNNLLLRGILDAASVKQSISSAYHPMSQGSVERFNGTMKTYLSRLLKPEEENQWDMVLNRIEFAYNVSVHGSTLLSPFEMLYGYRPEYPLDIILDPNTILEWDDSERLRAFQISKKYRDSMTQYVQDRALKERLRINAARSEEVRTEDWFPGQLVMRRNPKPSAIGTDFWFGPYLIDSVSDNGSVRIILPDGQTIPVNHRDLKAFIPKSISDVEEKKLELSRDLGPSELKSMMTPDAETKAESKESETSPTAQIVTLATDFLEWSLNPKFLIQAKHCYGELILGLHGDSQYLDSEEFKVVQPLREYKETSWIPILPGGGLPEGTFIFPDFQELDWIVDKLLEETPEVVLVVPIWKSRPWWSKLKSMVTDLPILIPRSTDSFSFQGRPIGRARWHAAILRLNQNPRLRLSAARKEELENFLFTVDRWMTNLEKLPRSANPGDVETILQDLEDTRARCNRPQLKDLPGVQGSA